LWDWIWCRATIFTAIAVVERVVMAGKFDPVPFRVRGDHPKTPSAEPRRNLVSNACFRLGTTALHVDPMPLRKAPMLGGRRAAL
jgi:hypothetical protein